MHNWRIVDDVYLYDGSIEGLLTIVNKCLENKTIPRDIKTDETYEADLLTIPIFIETNLSESKLIYNRFARISKDILYNVHTSLLSSNKDKEIIILKYLIYALKYGSKINEMKSSKWVIAIDKLRKQVKWEAHRLSGFVRFRLIAKNILYSEIEPDHNVVEFLTKHFMDRLPNERWIIYDKKRGLAAMYSNKQYEIYSLSNLEVDNCENEPLEQEYEDMWKSFYESITIKERTNRRCQLNHMPKKYWKNMLEMRDKL